MAPCAHRAPGGDVRPGVAIRAENPVGSLCPFVSACTVRERLYRGDVRHGESSRKEWHCQTHFKHLSESTGVPKSTVSAS